MKTKLVFENGQCSFHLIPENEWEQKLLGAVANGGDSLSASVKYKTEGHFTYGKCSAVEVVLIATEQDLTRKM